MSPLTPLTISVAVPAAIGAASPVCTRLGMVMNPKVAEANTHGASGMAQLSAHAVPRRAAVDAPQPCAVAGAILPPRRTATAEKTVAATTRAAASPNDT